MTSETNGFVSRHIGPNEAEVREMLEALGYRSLDELVSATVPAGIRMEGDLRLGEPRDEEEVLAELRQIAGRNQLYRSYIGMGYYGTITPPVIQRNVLENPGWYTAYTPYQAEIAQGRLEALLNFQTMVIDLTGLPIANASLLDEATAGAEAMALSYHASGSAEREVYFVSDACHPQTIEVVRTRAEARGLEVRIGDQREVEGTPDLFGVLFQYPATDGRIDELGSVVERLRGDGVTVALATDLLALALLKSPGEIGADIAVGSTQRFGVPMGYGGPHAAFFATRDEFKRMIPGRIIGVSRDETGRPALRMALQTREQHIRREKATSNICTAQVLLAVIAGMYAVYHGPAGIRQIAEGVHGRTRRLARGLADAGHELVNETFFDTLHVRPTGGAQKILERARGRGINLRSLPGGGIGISLDETVTRTDVDDLLEVFGASAPRSEVAANGSDTSIGIPPGLRRSSAYLTHSVFNTHHSETELLRYMHELEARDFSLVHGMIPLGSCTMKLNATAEMIPVTWPEFSQPHPFAPVEQMEGYQELFGQLRAQLKEITGFADVSLQPNAGSQGEYAGLLAIHRYHQSRGEAHRDVCLIPQSAHGTNPASAVMAGMQVTVVKTDDEGNIDVDDLRERAASAGDRLAALMVTYPSTHGVFEESIREVCRIVHEHGGQVYMDGANMNALVGLCRPAEFGADVCHLNLHKTFCIPHGGGGPGMGPIGVAEHLVEFLPGHPVIQVTRSSDHPVSAAPWGSSSILPISWVYIKLMGAAGLRRATEVAILNANYIAHRLKDHFPVLFTGPGGAVAHECIIDPRPLRASAGVEVEDIAKRLMDYGFHAPTVSFPVIGTLMIEPTESEAKAELDRFCDAMIAIREEAREIELGMLDRENNPLKRAPHPADVVAADEWDRAYSRERAAYPTADTRRRKFWPSVGRVESAYGDRNLVCACLPMEAYAEV